MNRLDRIIATVAPGIALRREMARRSLRRFEREGGRGGYEGASRSRRTDRWLAQGTDAVAAMAAALPLLRNRSRDMVRNNAWAARGVDAVATWTVGTGIVGEPTGDSLGARRLRDLWSAWSRTNACDADRCLDFAGLQALAMRCVVESGSVLIRRRTRRDGDGLPVPLQLQLLEPDVLDLERYTGQGSNEVIQGIEYDAIGRPVAYWIYPEHPGTDRRRSTTWVSQRVPATEILHVFRGDRIGQVQGVPWLTPALIRLRNLDEFEDANLLRSTIASSWAAFVTRAGDPLSDDGEPLDELEEIRPGAVEYLNAGETVHFPDLPSVQGIDQFTAAQLRAISATLPVPYEVLTGDLSRVNFSSGRMGFNMFARNVRAWQANLERQFLDPVRVWFTEAAISTGAPPSSASIPWAWTPPARMILDPQVEGQADYEAVRNGALTLSDMLRARGKDPRKHLEELAADLELARSLGLKLDCDGALVAKAGAGAAGTPGDAQDGEAEDETTDSEESGDGEAESGDTAAA